MMQSTTREDAFPLVAPALCDNCKGDDPGLRLRSNCGDFKVIIEACLFTGRKKEKETGERVAEKVEMATLEWKSSTRNAIFSCHFQFKQKTQINDNH
eukprot:7726004-Ditylum_brightwellii.AAC.1